MKELAIKKEKEIKAQQKQLNVYKARGYTVAMANDIIQKFMCDLTPMEQKVLSYIISLIKPRTEIEKAVRKEYPLDYIFSVQDYCDVTGITYSGTNYEHIKKALKGLAQNKWWMIYDASETVDGHELESVVGWLDRVRIQKKTGKVYIKLHEEVAPYLFDLAKNFTAYELIYILTLKSGFSIRLYQICKSWQHRHGHTYTVDEFRKLMNIHDIKTYENFGKIRERVLNVAIKEINEKTDIKIAVETINKKGSKKVEKIRLRVAEYSETEQIFHQALINDELDGTDTYGEQISLFNSLGHMKKIEEMTW